MYCICCHILSKFTASFENYIDFSQNPRWPPPPSWILFSKCFLRYTEFLRSAVRFDNEWSSNVWSGGFSSLFVVHFAMVLHRIYAVGNVSFYLLLYRLMTTGHPNVWRFLQTMWYTLQWFCIGSMRLEMWKFQNHNQGCGHILCCSEFIPEHKNVYFMLVRPKCTILH